MSAGFALVGPLGPLELGIILLILIVVFGPKRLPGIGRSLGEGMREFKDSITGGKSDEEKQELPTGSDPEPEKRSEPAMAAVDADAGTPADDPSRTGQ